MDKLGHQNLKGELDKPEAVKLEISSETGLME